MFYAFARGIARLPLPALHMLGVLVGWAAFLMDARYRRCLRENLSAAGYTSQMRQAIAEAGKSMVELPAIWLSDRARVAQWIVDDAGVQAVHAAFAQGHGLMVVTPHLGCWELVGRYAAQRWPFTAMYRPAKLTWLNPLVRSGRHNAGMRLAPTDFAGVRSLLKALRRGECVGLLPDQAPASGQGAWAEFFGRPAYTMTLAGRLQNSTGARIVFVVAERLPRGRGYQMHFELMEQPLPSEPIAQADALNRTVERLIRRCPTQYLWGYNRFKVPGGGAAPEVGGAA